MAEAAMERVRIKGQDVGTLAYGPKSDFPWAHGCFVAGAAFDSFSKYFRLRSGAHPAGELELDFDLLEHDGTPSDQVCLVSDPPSDEPTFLHALILRPDGSAAWRFGMEPF